MSRIALLAHGAGSAPATALRLLGTAVDSGVSPVAIDARGTVEDVVTRLAAAAAGHDVALAAGLSFGAHAVAHWSIQGGRAETLLLVMPAWTGPPGPLALLTSLTAADIETRGRDAVLAAIAAVTSVPRDPVSGGSMSEDSLSDDWVLEELRDGWSTYTDAELAAALRSAAASPAPTLEELARLTPLVGVVALADDPLHPEEVARDWARSIARAEVERVERREPAADRGALGRAGRAALARVSGSR